MRRLPTYLSTVFIVTVYLLCCVTSYARSDCEVKGKLTAGYSFPLDAAQVTILTSDGVPVATVRSDFAGRYSFNLDYLSPSQTYRLLIRKRGREFYFPNEYEAIHLKCSSAFGIGDLNIALPQDWSGGGYGTPYPTPTPMATPTPRPNPSQIPTPRPSPSPSPIRTPTPFPTPTPKPTPHSHPTYTPTPAPSPSPGINPGTQDERAVIDKLVNDLRDGRLAFLGPNTMDQGVPVNVSARITSQELNNAISQGLQGSGFPQLEPIKVGPIMKVFLTGEEGAFKITRTNGSEEQVVEGKPFAQWDWEVIPQKWGTRKLYLAATATLLVPGRGEKPVDVPVLIKPIAIKVNYSYMVKSFLSNVGNWSYLLGGTSLAAIIAAVWKWLKGRGSHNGNPPGWENV